MLRLGRSTFVVSIFRNPVLYQGLVRFGRNMVTKDQIGITFLKDILDHCDNRGTKKNQGNNLTKYPIIFPCIRYVPCAYQLDDTPDKTRNQLPNLLNL